MSAVEVHFYLDGRLLMIDLTSQPPRRGDEYNIDGQTFEVVRAVRHLGCPPDRLHAHLAEAAPELIDPSRRG